MFGDSEGGVTICNQDFSLHRFVAYEGSVEFAYQVETLLLYYRSLRRRTCC